LGVSERTVREMLGNGTIPSFTIGGSRVIRPEAVDAFIAEREAAG
jgi:excisionase family DNA binding protein